MSTICISIHAPTRGATLFVAVKVWYPIFQSTLPREERLCAGFSLYLCTDFNPRSHERSDMRSVTQKCINCEFQSTLPREERLYCCFPFVGRVYFNPRSHERSDDSSGNSVWDNLISIHAPTRGATKKSVDSGDMMSISIHAPTRGATISNVDFKSIPYISIHAPTRGATDELSEISPVVIFQSTLPREERRIICIVIFIFNKISIHAPTRGATLCAGFSLYLCSNFNPRSHERSDEVVTPILPCILPISIHAPTRGATDLQHVTCITSTFQSTLPREERPVYLK